MRRAWILLLSLIYFALRWSARAMMRSLGEPTRGRCRVLYYHGVPSHRIRRFGRQMACLSKRTRTLRSDFRGPLASGCHHTVLTFDDGYQSVVDNALPILEKMKIPCTFFIPPVYLGKKPGWHEKWEPIYQENELMTRETLEKIASPAVMIGSHSDSHLLLANLDRPSLVMDLKRSRETLEEMVGRPVKQLSFPYGVYNGKVLEAAREAGYDRVFSTEPLPAYESSDEFLTGRTEITLEENPLEFFLKVQGCYWTDWHAHFLKAGIRSFLNESTAKTYALIANTFKAKGGRAVEFFTNLW
ncbi:MAG: polysaccharide deacetylase family protein [Candidatus Omnitrophica bacterium]|nr:polysaccharide deacetylase family protein [Candidatus Omnitrophota bacterium]